MGDAARKLIGVLRGQFKYDSPTGGFSGYYSRVNVVKKASDAGLGQIYLQYNRKITLLANALVKPALEGAACECLCDPIVLRNRRP